MQALSTEESILDGELEVKKLLVPYSRFSAQKNKKFDRKVCCIIYHQPDAAQPL